MPVHQRGPDDRPRSARIDLWHRQRRHRTVVSSDVTVRKSGREAPRVVGGQSGCQSPLPFPEPLDGATVSLRQNRAAGAQVRALRCVVIAKHLFQRQVKVRQIPIVGLGETQIDAVSSRYPVARQGDCLVLCADSGDREQSVHSIMNTDSGDHEHLFAPA
jgi:hypothetical protein